MPVLNSNKRNPRITYLDLKRLIEIAALEFEVINPDDRSRLIKIGREIFGTGENPK